LDAHCRPSNLYKLCAIVSLVKDQHCISDTVFIAFNLTCLKRLTSHIHAKYLDNMNFYKIANLDDRIKNADQCITEDVARWCTSVSDLYSNLSKPVLDTLVYNYELTKRVGGEGVGVAILTAQLGSFILRALAPQFGKMVSHEAEFVLVVP
jgi:ABC-type uncharacterized transport system fused permease/ATPase subunit